MVWRAPASSILARAARPAKRSAMKSAVRLQWVQRSSRGPSDSTIRSRGASEPASSSVCPKCAVMDLLMLDDDEGDVIVEFAGSNMVHQIADDAGLDLLGRPGAMAQCAVAQALDPEHLALLVRRLGDAVGMENQHIALFEGQ